MKKQLQANEIEKYLNEVDAEFVPELSTRVNIKSYSCKLAGSATHFCEFEKNELVAFLALYCNDEKSGLAFVSSVSVLPDCKGRGIGRKLLNEAIQYARENNYRLIKLEVDDRNRAKHLYESAGFEVEERKGSLLRMVLRISY